MADRTLGFKVTDEVHERARMLIESSGLTSKEWLENALAMYEVKALQANTPDYAKDLTELELHTTRIYELVINMIQQSLYLKDHAVKDISDKLESKEAIILDFQQQLAQLKEEMKLKNSAVTALEEQEKELKEKLKTNEITLENNQALIAEYKEKNDTLNGLVAKYQAYADENEQLKIEFSKEKSALVERASTAESEGEMLKQELIDAQKTLAAEQQKFEDTLQLAVERKNLEREKALVELERQQQAQLAKVNEQHNEQIQALYAEIAELRKTNEANREKYQAEIEALKAQDDK